MNIDITIQLEKKITKAIYREYNKSADNITDENLIYIKKLFKKKTKLLSHTGVGWHKQMASVAKVFFEIIDRDSILFTPEISNKIAAALLYLCDPFDIIPDHTPEKGLVDDALVLNYCLNDIKRYDKKSYDVISLRIQEQLHECD